MRLCSLGPCQAAAWQTICWRARDRQRPGTHPLGGGDIGGDTAAILPGLKLSNVLVPLHLPEHYYSFGGAII